MTFKPLLVGESNPYGADPKFALYPAPDRSAGHRLATQILDMDRRRYLQTFDRVNLCAAGWSLVEARQRARQITRERDFLNDAPDGAGRSRAVVILLGAKVCSAFGVPFAPFTEDTTHGDPCVRLLVLPHPSGLSRLWNAVGTYTRARLLLRSAGVDLGTGPDSGLTVSGAAG